MLNSEHQILFFKENKRPLYNTSVRYLVEHLKMWKHKNFHYRKRCNIFSGISKITAVFLPSRINTAQKSRNIYDEMKI